MQQRRFSLNLLAGVVQLVASLVVYYLLYRFLFARLGPERMGVWSLVLVMSSTASISSLGIGSSVVRFSAQLNAVGDRAGLARLLTVALTFIVLLFGLAGSVLYAVAPHWIGATVSAALRPEAQSLIGYTIGSLMLNAVSFNVLNPVLDGQQKTYLRNALTVANGVLLLIFSLWLVPRRGLVGAGMAQLCQAAVGLLLTALVVARHAPLVLLFRQGWDKPMAGQLLRLGAREQVISLCLLSLDPVTRTFIARDGGLAMTAYYELANRLVVQGKSLLLLANQLMLPIYSVRQNPEQPVSGLYDRHFHLNAILAMIAMAGVVASGCLVSWAAYGRFVPLFILCLGGLAVAYLCNALSLPPYYANISVGRLRPNVASTLVIAILNAALCAGGGWLFGGLGVLAGWVLALSVGSLSIIVLFERRRPVRWHWAEPRIGRDLVLLVGLVGLAVLPGWQGFGLGWQAAGLGVALVGMLFVALGDSQVRVFAARFLPARFTLGRIGA